MQFIKSLAVLSVLPFVISACSSEQDGARRPEKPANVIVMVANDLGVSHVGAYGWDAPTPHINALAKNGVRFDAAYAPSPLSGPSRAGLMTGTHPRRIGFEYDNTPADRALRDQLGLPQDVKVFPEYLKQAAYKTSAIGVWHLGFTRFNYPTARGFDAFYGVLTSHAPYMRPSAQGMVHVPTDDYRFAPARARTNGVVQGNPPERVLNDERLLTEDLADQAVSYINHQNGEEPFFLYLGFNAPHTPLETTRTYYDRFSHIEDEKTRIYWAMIAALDEAVGRVVAAVENQGLAENTLIIFTSATGCALESGQCTCSTMKGAKGSLFEGGLRVPLIARWDTLWPKGAVYDDAVSLLDLAATTLSAAKVSGARTTFTDSVDLTPYVTGARSDAPHRVLYWGMEPTIAAREDGWKLILDDRGQFAPRLYNLKEDPLERDNLAPSRLDKMLELKSRIDPWRTELSPPLWEPTRYETTEICGDLTLIPR